VAEDRSSITHRRPRRLWFFAALGGVILIQVLYALLVFTWLGHWIGYQMAGRGQFGDLFGGVNALFTGLAFAGVIYHPSPKQRTRATARGAQAKQGGVTPLS
jgi:hypothetical protein